MIINDDDDDDDDDDDELYCMITSLFSEEASRFSLVRGDKDGK